MASKQYEYCTKTQLVEILADLDATEESIKNGIQCLKEWMRKQPHLPVIEDDEWLFNFLLKSKNSLEIAKKKIEEYFTIKTLMPEIFQDRDPCSETIMNASRQGCYIPTLKLTPDGYRVIIFQIFDNSENSFSDAESILKLVQIMIDHSLKVDKIRGTIFIHDLQNASLNVIAKMLPQIRNLVSLTLKANPGRFQKVYLLHMKPALEPIISFTKSLMKKKLGERWVIWKDDPKKLATVLPKEVLPAIYGGELELTMEELRDIWFEEVKKCRDWFISDEKNKADLSKKPADDLYENDAAAINYGINGSFRKICVD
ncbi:alpha-tocopherol transfer protein-like [Planococcus citri]|uniref:alpha-tocopherol transfer protein-like n=1 Tax=Planococcus citri TaxID=170843 RepID=UPI0031F944B8